MHIHSCKPISTTHHVAQSIVGNSFFFFFLNDYLATPFFLMLTFNRWKYLTVQERYTKRPKQKREGKNKAHQKDSLWAPPYGPTYDQTDPHPTFKLVQKIFLYIYHIHIVSFSISLWIEYYLNGCGHFFFTNFLIFLFLSSCF